MTQEQYEALVKRLEDYAAGNPGGYRLRVGLLAALGYGYIFFVLAALVAGFIFLVLAMLQLRLVGLVIKFGWLLLLFAVFIVRSLWVRLPPPEGLELKRKDASHLFEVIDELQATLRAPRIHRVLINDEFNASIVQIPRLSVLGWQRNYLTLGLPLMQALSPRQFRAVVAHEMGHLSGNHGRFTGWIYRQRVTWIQLLVGLRQAQHWGAVVFERFINWYAPYFNAYSFVLARAQEYEADRSAARIAGPKDAAEALINLEIKGKFLERDFWPGVLKKADQQIEPPSSTFAEMFRLLGDGSVATVEATKWFVEALGEKTDYEDTHPRLSDRLVALGYLSQTDAASKELFESPPLPTPHTETAAARYLGDAVNIVTRLDSDWKERVAPQWRERYEYSLKSQKKLQQLEQKAQQQSLGEEETWERIQLVAEFKGNESVLPLLGEVLEHNPNHAAARYALGGILLERGDAAGIEHVERAMEQDPEYVLSGSEAVYWFLKKQGREDEAGKYQKRAEQHYELLELARGERQTVSEQDQFKPHGLSPPAIENLRWQFDLYDEVKEAYLVQKLVRYFPEKPFYVFGVVQNKRWYKLESPSRGRLLAQKIAGELNFDGPFNLVILDASKRKLKDILSRTEGAQIYKA